MRISTLAWGLGVVLASCFYFLAAQSSASPATVTAAGFTNLGFELGTPDQAPLGWVVPKTLAAQGFTAILTTNYPKHGKRCAEIRWPTNTASMANGFANLMQVIDATPWRGKRIEVTAAVRVASTEGGQRAQMWLRVDGPRGVSVLDNMDDRPIVSTNWADYSVAADVEEDAQKILLGLMTLKGVTAWFDDVRIRAGGDPPVEEIKILEGNWKGALELGPLPLRVFLVFESDAADRMRGYFVSPDQTERRLPLTWMRFESNLLSVAVGSIGGTYTGRLDRAAREIRGVWKQGAVTLPLALAVTETGWTVRRPQTPKPPFPYESEEVVFENLKAKVKLAGTLTRPAGRGPFPALVLISGSGPQDRDETLFQHKPFAIIADFLSRNGYAVLRYDDRGTGKSAGDFHSATSADFSYDAQAAMDYLKSRPEMDRKCIGFLGHSEGGLITPMIAARRADVAFAILLAAPGISGEEIALAQEETFSRVRNFSEESIQKCRPLNREMIGMLKSDLTLEEKEAKLNELEQRMIPLLGEKDKQLYDSLKAQGAANRGFGLAQIQSPWMQFMLRYDPAADFQRVRCPVLALNGELDTQVLAAQNLPAIAQHLKTGGNTHFTTKELKGLNHLFQTAPTGALKEYAEIEESFSPIALSEILHWLRVNGKAAEY
jgi:uncharacterized protein